VEKNEMQSRYSNKHLGEGNMKKSNQSKWVLATKIIALCGLAAASESAYAQLGCTSEWVLIDKKPDCQVHVLRRGSVDKISILGSNLEINELKAEESCEQLCKESNPKTLHRKLEELVFAAHNQLEANTEQLTQVLTILYKEFQMTTQVAEKACLKTKKLKLIIETLKKSKMETESTGESMEEGEEENSSKKEESKYLPYFS
jgi:hypothetical protein